MTPEEISSLALKYASGELTAAEQGEIDLLVAQNSAFQTELEHLRQTWSDLGALAQVEPSAALRVRFHQKLNAVQQGRHLSSAPWWKRQFIPQIAAGLALFLAGIATGRLHQPVPAPDPQISHLQDQVEGLRQTVALSLIDKQSASSRLQGVEWGSRVDRPDQELLNALSATLNHDQNINVRLAALDALAKFTSDAGVRLVLEQSITHQQSPLLQIALIDALVHIGDSDAAPEFKRLSGNSTINAAVRQRAQWAVQKLSLE